jgi:hypothetical protein
MTNLSRIFLTVRQGMAFVVRGGIRTTAMIETVTALFGVLSAGILAAHAYDGYRARF